MNDPLHDDWPTFVQIHVDAYMFTRSVKVTLTSIAKRGVHQRSPLTRTRPRRNSRRDPPTAEPVLPERPDVPGIQASRAQEHAAAELEGAVDRLDLRVGFGARRREPIHAVHQHGDREGAGLHTGEDFRELVRVDAQAVEGVGLGELDVRFRREVARVALPGVFACAG